MNNKIIVKALIKANNDHILKRSKSGISYQEIPDNDGTNYFILKLGINRYRKLYRLGFIIDEEVKIKIDNCFLVFIKSNSDLEDLLLN